MIERPALVNLAEPEALDRDTRAEPVNLLEFKGESGRTRTWIHARSRSPRPYR